MFVKKAWLKGKQRIELSFLESTASCLPVKDYFTAGAGAIEQTMKNRIKGEIVVPVKVP